jgi:hypothetical protein
MVRILRRRSLGHALPGQVYLSLGVYLANLKDTCNLELHFRNPDDGYNGDPFSSTITFYQTVMID